MALSGSAAWKATGLGTRPGSLEKLHIEYEVELNKKGWHTGRTEDFPVMFNPNELRFRREVLWEPEEAVYRKTHTYRQLVYKRLGGKHNDQANLATLDVSFFFDTSDPATANDLVRNFLVPTNPFARAGGGPRAMLPGAPAPTPTDVRTLTGKLTNLARVSSDLHRPPICRLRWGERVLFRGVLAKLDERLTLFTPDGTPVRATVACQFLEYDDLFVHHKRELHSSDVAKTVVVGATDSLHAIAAAEYNDPGQWRLIARANGITNPRAVAPGTVLILPPLPS